MDTYRMKTTILALFITAATTILAPAVAAAPITIPVSSVSNGVDLSYRLPPGQTLHEPQNLQLSFQFDGLTKRVNYRLFYDVGGIWLPVSELFENAGGIFVPVNTLGDGHITFLSQAAAGLINRDSGGFNIALHFDPLLAPTGAGRVTSVLLSGRYSDLSPFQTELVPAGSVPEPSASVPEPSSVLLLGTALLGLSVQRWRTKRRR